MYVHVLLGSTIFVHVLLGSTIYVHVMYLHRNLNKKMYVSYLLTDVYVLIFPMILFTEPLKVFSFRFLVLVLVLVLGLVLGFSVRVRVSVSVRG